jgi:uncharacterized protein (DUF1778 family)
MAGRKKKDGWLVGRTRHVRVYLTEEEHARVRAAAAMTDRSVSRFSVEAIVAEADKRIAEGTTQPAPKSKKRGGQ